MGSPPVHIAMFPSPGMGHLTPFLHLAKLLLHRRHVSSATLILPSSPLPLSLLLSLPHNLSLHHLPPLPTSPTPENQTPESQIFRTISLSLASAASALASLPHLSALVVDPFGLDDLLPTANHLRLPTFLYFGTAAMNLLFTFHLPKFDQMFPNRDHEFRDAAEPFLLPRCVPLHGRDFGDPFMSRKSDTFKKFLHLSEITASVDGILINSFTDLEPGALTALKEDMYPPVFGIGPIVGSGQEEAVGPVVKWLDGQPVGSVLYVSFGSGGTLSYEQTKELALGLEESAQRFVWVVRCPNDANSCPSYCGGDDVAEDPDPLGFLPEGFVERTSGRGNVVANWAPQVEVLRNGAIGGFLTHCGWNSALEGIMNGVPMIAWPLYAEQRTNAVVLSDGLGVAVRPEGERGGGVVIGREEVARVVRRVMEEGEERERVRERARELKEGARRAVGEGGSSTMAVDEFGARLKGHGGGFNG